MSVAVEINGKTFVGLGVAAVLIVLACKTKSEAAKEILTTIAKSLQGRFLPLEED